MLIRQGVMRNYRVYDTSTQSHVICGKRSELATHRNSQSQRMVVKVIPASEVYQNCRISTQTSIRKGNWMVFRIENRNGYLSTRGTQTVNICGVGNTPGQGQQYCDFVIRLSHDKHVEENECASCGSIANLVGWLHFYKYGKIEKAPPGFDLVNEDEVRPPVTGTEDIDERPDDDVEREESRVSRSPSDGELRWLERAVALCEAAIDEFIGDFLESPYLHRVEHSAHCMLFAAITGHRHFQGEYPLADGTRTQLVHKEWPETVPRPRKRRGNFDLAILSPQRVRAAHLADFRAGRITPSIVIEVGLDYDEGHLADDDDKLVNSLTHQEIGRGYLIHLVRERPHTSRVVQLLNQPGHERIGTAYAHVFGGQMRRKLVCEAAIDVDG